MLKYKIIKRKNPINHSTKFYGQLENTTPVDRNQLFDEIAEECTVTSADVKAVIDRLELKIVQKLRDGKSIRLGDLGSFHLRMQSKGVDDAKDFKVASHVKGLLVRFIRSSKMHNEFKMTNPNVKIELAK